MRGIARETVGLNRPDPVPVAADPKRTDRAHHETVGRTVEGLTSRVPSPDRRRTGYAVPISECHSTGDLAKFVFITVGMIHCRSLSDIKITNYHNSKISFCLREQKRQSLYNEFPELISYLKHTMVTALKTNLFARYQFVIFVKILKLGNGNYGICMSGITKVCVVFRICMISFNVNWGYSCLVDNNHIEDTIDRASLST